MCKKISSLTEFVKQIEDATTACAYWRGEKKDYKGTKLTAGGLRDSTYDYNIVQKYYSEVFSRLTENEEKNFLAFCQHHELKTNILDITQNPLIALWFACIDKPCEDGYVYGFADPDGSSYKYYIDITNIIQESDFFKPAVIGNMELFTPSAKEMFTGKCRKKLLDLLAQFCLSNFGAFISRFEKNNCDFICIVNTMLRHVDNYNSLYIDNSLYGRPDINIYISKLKNTAESKKDVIGGQKQYFESFAELRNGNNEVYFQEIFKYYFAEEIMAGSNLIVPRMIYQPLLSFDRAVSQKGLFLFQWFAPGSPSQVYEPDLTIKIPKQNKAAIIKSLDKIGINRSTVYCDFDNIAKYCNETYQSKLLIKLSP